MEDGDHVIICLDTNEDVRYCDTHSFFAELREVILEKHLQQVPPETCDKNKRFEPIDRIFATRCLNAIAAGYTTYGDFCPQCNHHGLWIDLTF